SPVLSLALAASAIALLIAGTRVGQLLPLALGLSAAVLSAERAMRWALRAPSVRQPAIGRAVTLSTCALLAVIWLQPRDVVTALALGRPAVTPEVFPVSGIALALASVWAVAANLGPLLAGALWPLRPFRAARLLGRLSAAYLGQQSFRAGTAMAMF